MKRRHRVAAEWVPEEPPKWAACRRDRVGGGLIAVLTSVASKSMRPVTDDEREEVIFRRWDGLLRRLAS